LQCLVKITVIYPNKFGAGCLNLQLQGNLPRSSAFAHAWVAHNQAAMVDGQLLNNGWLCRKRPIKRNRRSAAKKNTWAPRSFFELEIKDRKA